jgi:hypothetical protein
VADGRTESPVHSLDDSIGIARALDAARADLGTGAVASVSERDTSTP